MILEFNQIQKFQSKSTIPNKFAKWKYPRQIVLFQIDAQILQKFINSSMGPVLKLVQKIHKSLLTKIKVRHGAFQKLENNACKVHKVHFWAQQMDNVLINALMIEFQLNLEMEVWFNA